MVEGPVDGLPLVCPTCGASFHASDDRMCPKCYEREHNENPFMGTSGTIPGSNDSSIRMSMHMSNDFGKKLSVDQLAEALYEGTPHLENLAEKLARQHGSAEALSFYGLMGDDVQNFWKLIAIQIIEHSMEWILNEGSACVLSDRETARLRMLPRDIKPGDFNSKFSHDLSNLIPFEGLSCDTQNSKVVLRFKDASQALLVYKFLLSTKKQKQSNEGTP